MNITLSTDFEAVVLLIIGFSIVIYHFFDAEVGGPLIEPLKDRFKKVRFYFIKTSSPKKLQTVSVLSQISHLVSLQNKPTQFPPPAPTATTLQREG